MGIPEIETRTLSAIDKHRICFRNLYRAENLCYQFKHGQKLPPQFHQIICLVKVGRDTHTRYYGCGKFQPIRSVLIHGIYSFEDGFRAATAASIGAPSSMDKYENAWHSVAKPPRRRSGIIRERHLSMRVPTSPLANDVQFCKEMTQV